MGLSNEIKVNLFRPTYIYYDITIHAKGVEKETSVLMLCLSKCNQLLQSPHRHLKTEKITLLTHKFHIKQLQICII